jgi:SAM-dependent methyltransferase
MKIRQILGLIRHIPSIVRETQLLRFQAKNSDYAFPITKIKHYPLDIKKQSGNAKGHYFHQDLWVAQCIYDRNPEKHVDIGSRVDGFVAHVAAFRPIEVFDIRPLNSNSRNITFKQADLLALDDRMENYCDSLSCLHAIEHFGLGRYGDSIDFEGHIKGLASLYKILKSGGLLYLSCPIGPQRIEFNAHRVFSILHILNIIEGKFKLNNFSFVDDNGDLHVHAPLTEEVVRRNCSCTYGCGIFEIEKI